MANPIPLDNPVGRKGLEDEIDRLAALGLMVHSAARPGPPARVGLEKIDTLGEGVAIIEPIHDPAGKVVDLVYLEVNGAFELHTGWQSSRGRRRSEIAPIADDDWLEGVDRVLRTGEPEHWETFSRYTRRWYRCFFRGSAEQAAS